MAPGYGLKMEMGEANPHIMNHPVDIFVLFLFQYIQYNNQKYKPRKYDVK